MWHRSIIGIIILWCCRNGSAFMIISKELPVVQSLLLLPTQPLPPSQRSSVPKLPVLSKMQRHYQWTSSKLLVTTGVVLRRMSSDNNENNNDAANEPTLSTSEYDTEVDDLKREITKYLQLRKEIGADDIAKECVY